MVNYHRIEKKSFKKNGTTRKNTFLCPIRYKHNRSKELHRIQIFFPRIILFTGQSRVLPSNRGLKYRLENNPKQQCPIPTDVARKVRIDT